MSKIDGTIKSRPICMTITIVTQFSDQTESEWQAGVTQLMQGIERELRAAFPSAALGHPPVTINITELPGGW